MPERLFKHKVKILFGSMFVCALVFVRAFENELFYDPFLHYFKLDFVQWPLPEINNLQLLAGLFYRYTLNTFFSLGIIYIAFKDLDLTKFSAVIYSVFFVILIAAFFAVLIYSGEENKMVLFYIRRFLIQPILLLLFLPAFYYQKMVSKK